MRDIQSRLCCLGNLSGVLSWSTDEMEVFDAVEEVKHNFYTLLDVPQTASLREIKKSFRKLSLITHPDHNLSPTADEEFRHLVLAFDTLKSVEKRQYYDNILINGLPDWKDAVYYYRRVRKMGLKEMFIILTAIVSVGQYLIAWAAYLEQKFTVKELLKSKDKKLMRKLKKNKTEYLYSDEFIESAISKPSVKNTLPFQICYLIKDVTVWTIKFCIKKMKENWKEELNVKELSCPRKPQVKPSYERPKKIDFVPELAKVTPPVKDSSTPTTNKVESAPIVSGGLWTDDDIYELIKLVKKHPVGESQRWIKIAWAMGRTVAEVTHMSNKIKINDFRLPTDREEITEVIQEPKKVKTKDGKLGTKLNQMTDDLEKNSVWTQIQQKAFEMALNKYSKNSITNRWEKIANCIPGKNKEDCILRYKKITSILKERDQDIPLQSNADNLSNQREDNKEDEQGAQRSEVEPERYDLQ